LPGFRRFLTRVCRKSLFLLYLKTLLAVDFMPVIPMMRQLISGNACCGTEPPKKQWERTGFLIALAPIAGDYRDNIEK
jgi:hypothetical protein